MANKNKDSLLFIILTIVLKSDTMSRVSGKPLCKFLIFLVFLQFAFDYLCKFIELSKDEWLYQRNNYIIRLNPC